MKIAVIGGTGDMGYGIALRLGMAGHSVVIGSRDEARAQEAAQRAFAQLNQTGDFTGLSNEDAGTGGAVHHLRSGKGAPCDAHISARGASG